MTATQRRRRDRKDIGALITAWGARCFNREAAERRAAVLAENKALSLAFDRQCEHLQTIAAEKAVALLEYNAPGPTVWRLHSDRMEQIHGERPPAYGGLT